MSATSPEIFAATEISDGLCPILATALDPDATSVLLRLIRSGHRAYLVGGCVRDLLLGSTPKDFDIATSARPRQVKKVFRNSRIIGRRFRLVHVMFGGNKTLEVSTFRRDPNAEGEAADAADPRLAGPDAPADGDAAEGWEAGGRAAADGGAEGDGDAANGNGDDDADLLIREDNVYGSEAEDAVRRDFTINGLFYDVQDQCVLDYVGGVADLRRRVLRTIGDAARRVREDPVRILRAVKFAVRLDLTFDPELAAAIAEHHEDLRRSAAPRVFEEILRMLGGPQPQKSVALLARLGVLRVLVPELGLHAHGTDDDPRLARLLDRLAALAEVDRGRRGLPTAMYLAVLFYDELRRRVVGEDVPTEGPHHAPSEALDAFLRPIGMRFRMAKRDTARVRAMLLAMRRLDPELAGPEARRRRHRGGIADFVRREFFHDALLLMRIAAVAEKRDLGAVLEWEERAAELAHEAHSHDARPHPPRPHAPPADSRSAHERPHEPGDRRGHEPQPAPPHPRRRRRRRRNSSRDEGGAGPQRSHDVPPPDDDRFEM
jgi:poly(A) polymerase